MDDIRALADDIFRERVLRARAASPDRRLQLGPELFDYACSVTLSGIRAQHPDFTDEDCRRELGRRLQIVRRLDEAGLYHPVETAE